MNIQFFNSMNIQRLDRWFVTRAANRRQHRAVSKIIFQNLNKQIGPKLIGIALDCSANWQLALSRRQMQSRVS